MKGYTKKIAKIDLKTRRVTQTTVSDKIRFSFIGGSGIGAKIFFDTVNPEVPPLDPKNPLFIMTGPLVGTMVPGSSRLAVISKSPLTEIWGEGTAGGYFPRDLKRVGLDGILIYETADKPLYIKITPKGISFHDARFLWGKDTYETVDILNKEEGRSRVMCIGPAGENGVKYASICIDKHHFIGRSGLGAVMGAKRLKAIICQAEKQKIEIEDPKTYEELVRRFRQKISESAVALSLRECGTDASMDLGMMTGDVPIKNWSKGEDFSLSSCLGGPMLTERYLVERRACYACQIACKRIVQIKKGRFKTSKGPGPEYETCATFGTLILNSELAGIIKANEICNRYGMDTISTGATIAFAMDLWEHGIIGAKDTENIELRWGNIDGVIKLLPKIGKREGFGEILSQGSRKMAQMLGKEAEKYAVEIKGLEVPMHDPRGFHGLGLAYMMASRGGCHLRHLCHAIEQGISAYPEAGFEENYQGPESKGKAKLVKLAEDFGIPLNSLLLCHFNMWCLTGHDVVSVLNAITGASYTLADYMECGERIWFLKRAILNMMGIRKKDDRLPQKILTPLSEGAAAGSVPDTELLLSEYYQLRGLDQRGFPKREKLLKLGLEEVSLRLYGNKEDSSKHKPGSAKF